jgi:hypothetical protein
MNASHNGGENRKALSMILEDVDQLIFIVKK